MDMRTTSTRNFKAGYQIHTGEWSHDGGDTWTPMKWATNPQGDFISDSRLAYRLCVKRGIAPELRTGNSNTCSVGFSEREQKWYGWSHRAIYGFGVGSEVDCDDHLCACSGYIDGHLEEHPEIQDDRLPVGFVAKSLEDARLMACAFAESVG